MKKIAAPGRRGSTKRTAFISDDDIVDEITTSSPTATAATATAAQELEKQKQEEAEALLELQRQQEKAEAIAERKRQIQEEKLRVEKEAERLRQDAERRRQEAEEAERLRHEEEALAEKKRLIQEEKLRREQELEKARQEEAEAAADLLRQQQEAEAIAERKRKIREEKIRLQQEADERAAEEAAAAEKKRLMQEEKLRREQELERERQEEAAAAAELLRQQQEAEAIAERKRLLREEKLRLELEAEQQREAEAAAELLRQQQEAEAIAERKRLLREEKLRLELEAEQQRKEAEEAEAELIRQQEAVEEEARERKRQLREEKIRKRKEEEEAFRLQQERDEAELLRQQEEEEQERQRQFEIEEKERLQNELRRQEEIRKLEEERERIEQERILKEKQNAAKAKSKRDAFLDDMDSFSDAFTQKQTLKEEQLQQTLAAKDDILASTISTTSTSYKAAPRTQKQESSAPVTNTTQQSSDNEVSVPAFYDQSQVVTPSESDNQSKVIQNQNPEKFNLLASALFSASSSNPTDLPVEEDDPYASTTKPDEGEVLRLPNRAVTVTKNKKNKSSVTFNEAEVLRAPVTGTEATGGDEKYGQDEEDEDEEALLPRMTEAEKAVWKAKQEDLTRRRKDFHGACTYAFKGVFSWQMYSAVDAVDEFGKAYTEYLMRCQWGTSWENMQPWLVARRFREFDTLNELLQKRFPDFKHKMYPLPKKLIFGSLTSETIDKRTKEIEEYMATIITDIPQMLRSRYIDEFFGISDRIKTISVQIEEINKKLPKTAPEDEPLYTGMVSLAPGVEEEMGREGNNRKDEMKSEGALAEEEKEVLARLQLEDLFTLEDIESLCNDNTRPFDSDELGQMEEYVRDLRSMLRKTKAKNIPTDANCRRYINLCQKNWVRLHRTCLIDPSGASGGVMLIPRAMQAEEELDHAIKELRSLLIAQSMGSPLHF